MEPPIRIVCLDRCTLPGPLRAPAFAHQWVDFWQTAPDEVLERLTGADIAVTNKVALRAPVLARLPGLRLIAVAATGADCIDLAWCHANGLPVSNVRGYAAGSVSEHVFMLVLALRRRLVTYRALLQAGAWEQAPGFCLTAPPIADLANATLGVVGFGELGQAVAALGRAFGMRVLVAERRGATPRPGRVAFEAVLQRSDVLTLHCPLTPETQGLIGAAELAQLKPDAVLVNTARGALVDPDALLEALTAGRLGGAGIDVLASEPPQPHHPLVEARLDSLIITPHVAWAGQAALAALSEQLIGNLEAFAAGQPRHCL